MSANEDSYKEYKVVVNAEEQYSIWPAEKENPPGWSEAGKRGSKEACLEYIKAHWIDMRPLSLRQKMAEWEKAGPLADVHAPEEAPTPSLIDRLCTGAHSVSVSLLHERSATSLKRAIDDGLVHLKLAQTRGGTEVGIKLDRGAVRTERGDFAEGRGTVHLEGNLTLDYVSTRCRADIDLHTLEGTVTFEKVAAPATV